MSSFPALFQGPALPEGCRALVGVAAQTVLYGWLNHSHILRQRLPGFVPSRLTRLWRGRCEQKVVVGASWPDGPQAMDHIGATLRPNRPRQTIDPSGAKEVGGR